MERVSDIVKRYQEHLTKELNLPNLSCGRSAIGKEGEPNRAFLHYLCLDTHRTIHFLQDAGLLKTNVKCCKCQADMVIEMTDTTTDKVRWACNKWTARNVRGNTIRKKCRARKSIRHGSWFSKSNLTIPEVLYLTYEIVNNTRVSDIQREYEFSSKTLADWANFYRDILVEYIESHSEKIGGPCIIVEVDESKFCRRKYYHGHFVEGQWVFGGIERHSGKTFFVGVQNRTSAELLKLIKQWISPGSVIITNGWKAYDHLGQVGYADLTVSHSVSFVNEEAGGYSNRLESTWYDVKAALPHYNKRKQFYLGHLATYVFNKLCRASDDNPVNKFLEIVRDIQ
jgi:transposase-like protein